MRYTQTATKTYHTISILQETIFANKTHREWIILLSIYNPVHHCRPESQLGYERSLRLLGHKGQTINGINSQLPLPPQKQRSDLLPTQCICYNIGFTRMVTHAKVIVLQELHP